MGLGATLLCLLPYYGDIESGTVPNLLMLLLARLHQAYLLPHVRVLAWLSQPRVFDALEDAERLDVARALPENPLG